MVKVTAVDNVKEVCIEEFLAITKELVEKTNSLDEGCIKYELCRDISNPRRFVMLDEWENQNVLDKHMKAKHFVELIPKLADLTAKPTELTILEKVY